MAENGCEVALLLDEELVRRITNGETHLFEIVVQRYSRRLLRIALSVLRNEAEAEDVVQDAFLSAYQHLGQFAGRAKFSTWLSRIALHRAFAVSAQGKRHVSLDDDADGEHAVRVVPDHKPTPEQHRYFTEIATLLTTAVAELPESYRSVLMMREFDEADTTATSRRLHISQANVKVRLHRARAMMRAHYDRALAAGIAPIAATDAAVIGLAM